MKQKNILALLFTLLSYLSGVSYAQNINIQPTPQKIVDHKSSIDRPTTFGYEGNDKCNPNIVKAVQSLLKKGQSNEKYKVIIGTKKDKAVKKYAKLIPSKKEGYYLAIEKDRIVLVGSDDRGLYYAYQTLSQIITQSPSNKLPLIEITDYPDIEFRGVVEGFYGTPWSYEARVRQLEFYGKNKMNTYIYGPKDDPYHSSPNWRVPYPEKEAENIKKLVDISHENFVDFVWAIHPGKDIKWNDEDRQNLLSKFENMYQLGVRSYAVFFDDISGEGTNPTKQAELLNFIDNKFVKAKKDVTPLIMCPTEYNKSWSNIEKGYLPTLGEKLNQSVHIMWTGNFVIDVITHEGLQWINQHIKRPAYIWWNFPVSDYVRDHLLMGPVYGNDLNIKNDMSGFVSNPMEYAEASKIAIYSVANYAWNLERFDSKASWKKALREVMPQSADALEVFASHNSDLGPNGHKFRRDESTDIKPLADKLLIDLKSNTASKEDMQAMRKEFDKIVVAANLLMGSKDNKPLIDEIEPWLFQFKNLGEKGTALFDLVAAYNSKDKAAFENCYRYIQALNVVSYNIDQSYNQNPYQPGIKTGTLVLQPFISNLFGYYVDKFNAENGTNLDSKGVYNPHRLSSDINQIKNIPLQTKRNQVIIAPVLEIVKWEKGKFIQFDLDKEYELQSLNINLAGIEASSLLTIQTSKDENNWTTIDTNKFENKSKIDLKGLNAKHIRITNTKESKDISFRGITLSLSDNK